MLKKFIMSDERSIQTYHKIGSKVYALTIWLLLLAIFYRRRVLGQTLEEFWDISAIFFITGLIYVLTNLYLIGILPERFKLISTRIYLMMVIFGLSTGIFSGRITSFKQGLESFIGISLAAGVVFVCFFLISFMGKKKMDSNIDE